jgi:hypothetical protein
MARLYPDAEDVTRSRLGTDDVDDATLPPPKMDVKHVPRERGDIFEPLRTELTEQIRYLRIDLIIAGVDEGGCCPAPKRVNVDEASGKRGVSWIRGADGATIWGPMLATCIRMTLRRQL